MNGGVLITLTRCPNSQIMHPVTQGTAFSICIYRGDAIFHVTRTLPGISESEDSERMGSVKLMVHLYIQIRNNVYFLITMHDIALFPIKMNCKSFRLSNYEESIMF